jgi:hypothetical protein
MKTAMWIRRNQHVDYFFRRSFSGLRVGVTLCGELEDLG